MSEQTPRRRRADRVYTPEENEAAPCRRRMNADEPPRRRRTREYYSPEEFIPYPAADSFDTMPPDIPFDVPPDTPSAPPKRKFRLPPLSESLRRTMQLLRSARPDFPFRRPHGVGDLLNMLLDVLLWLPKLTVHLTLYACRYLRASVRYAVEGATPLWQAFLLRPYSWAGFYLLENDTLVLGPFQGKLACVRIPVGRGVCGTAVAQNQVQRIEDVHAFDGHIACDSASNAEIVLPLTVDNQIIGVLDIDSTVFGRFTEEDEQGLRELVARLETVLATTDYKKFFATVAG